MSDSIRMNYLLYSPCATASVSILGSCLTLLTLYRSRRWNGKPLRTYHRLMIGISISDVLLSLGFAMGPWPMPATLGMPGGYGTMGTCLFQAILLQLGSASIPYSTMLLLYYLLVLRYHRWRNETALARYIEPWMHAVPITFHVTTAILGVAWQVFHPRGTHCWVAAFPLGCDEMPDVECERGGEYVELFGLWLLTIPFMIWNLILLLLIAAIAWTVVTRMRAGRRFVFRGDSTTNGGATTARKIMVTQSSNVGGSASTSVLPDSSIINSSMQPSQRPALSNAEYQTRQVLIQCSLYALTFCNMMIWSTMGTIFSLASVPYEVVAQHFWISALAVFFLPAQGLFNFLIFIRPRYIDQRKLHCNKDLWWWDVLWQAIWNPGTNLNSQRPSRPNRQRTSHCANSNIHSSAGAVMGSLAAVAGMSGSCYNKSNDSNDMLEKSDDQQQPDEASPGDAETRSDPRAFDHTDVFERGNLSSVAFCPLPPTMLTDGTTQSGSNISLSV